MLACTALATFLTSVLGLWCLKATFIGVIKLNFFLPFYICIQEILTLLVSDRRTSSFLKFQTLMLNSAHPSRSAQICILMSSWSPRKNWSRILQVGSAVLGWFLTLLPSRWLSGAVSQWDKPAGPKARSEARKPLAGLCDRSWQLQLSESGCSIFTSLTRTDRQLEGRSLFCTSAREDCDPPRLVVSCTLHRVLPPIPVLSGWSAAVCEKTFNYWKINQGVVMPWVQLLGLRAQLFHEGNKKPFSPCAGLLLGAPALTLAAPAPARGHLSVALSSVCPERLRNSLHFLILQLLLVTVNYLLSAKQPISILFQKHLRFFFPFKLSKLYSP